MHDTLQLYLLLILLTINDQWWHSYSILASYVNLDCLVTSALAKLIINVIVNAVARCCPCNPKSSSFYCPWSHAIDWYPSYNVAIVQTLMLTTFTGNILVTQARPDLYLYIIGFQGHDASMLWSNTIVVSREVWGHDQKLESMRKPCSLWLHSS